MKSSVIVLFLAVAASAQELLDNTGVQLAVKIYEDCSKAEGFSPCLKKKAITALDRLARMGSFDIAEGVVVTGSGDQAPEAPVTEEELEKSLPRGLDAKDAALTDILMDKVASFVQSKTIELRLPKVDVEEGRGKKKKGSLHLFAGLGTKLISLIPVAIAGLFLLAGKALITAKVALLIIGIITIKKLFAAKHAHEHGHGHGHGHTGGWDSGWDKRSMEAAHELAYNAYAPK